MAPSRAEAAPRNSARSFEPLAEETVAEDRELAGRVLQNPLCANGRPVQARVACWQLALASLHAAIASPSAGLQERP